ncbi:MAG: hypothetical protein M3342_23910 [Bacteroidota bacterium]|nr:hypothetical protein [Flavisolibacter sp.]MDQ3847032.1 hypothetical protein [Bacteroidota bacterium]
MEELPVHFRNKVYKITYDMEPVNWINVYTIFVRSPYLKGLVGDFFHILQVTTELQNTYWFGTKEGQDKEANEFKRTVANAIKALNGE